MTFHVDPDYQINVDGFYNVASGTSPLHGIGKITPFTRRF